MSMMQEDNSIYPRVVGLRSGVTLRVEIDPAALAPIIQRLDQIENLILADKQALNPAPTAETEQPQKENPPDESLFETPTVSLKSKRPRRKA